ncbi:hypothetical protein H1P_1890002 [Hyella patelloides LEGE 07179]|uniref:Uncharacterized protein n=1 Tax=Hyella patelloides LEGE 07179 TaxID=945734 RepID=A0A563VPH5_9CYAN|nr:hypothetical protein [Hyella patelloides]VEP13187.1 hypothetical protein H1P_1890002 [Hyella patelloides LEGE 07179]
MKPEINQQQTDWISQVEELDDIEASQVNGGSPLNDPSLSVEDKIFLLLMQVMSEFDKQIKEQAQSVRP